MCVRFVLLLFPFFVVSQTLETVIQKGHRGAAKCLAISHNGKFLVSGSRDKTAILWDLASQRQIRTFNGHGGSINSIAFSPDDKYIATASGDMTAKIWDISTGEIIYSLAKQSDYLTAVAFHPTRKILAIGGYPFEVLIVDYQNNTVLKRIECAPDKGVGSGITLKFSLTGANLLIGEDNKTARLFETSTYSEVLEMKNKVGYCGGCGTETAFSQSGRWVAKIAHNDTVRVYDISSGTLAAKLGILVDKSVGAEFSADEHTLYTVSDDTLRAYEWQSKLERKSWSLKKYNLADINGFALWESKGLALLATDKNQIVAIDLKTGDLVHSFSGINNVLDKGGINYDPESYWESYIARYIYLKSYFITLNDDKSFVTGKMGTDAIQWNLASGQPERFFDQNEKAVICFDKWEAKNLLIAGNAAGQIAIWDYRKHKLLKQINAHREPIFGVKINTLQNQLIVSSWDATISIWDMNTYEKISTISMPNNYSAFSFNIVKNGNYIALGQLDKSFKLIEPETKEIVRSFIGHTDVVSSITENPQTGELLTSSWDGTARIWDLNSGLMVLKMKAPSGLNAAIYHPDLSKIYTAGTEGLIRVWDSKTAKPLGQLKGHQAEVTQLQISKDGKYLFSLSTDGTLKYWKLDAMEELYEHVRLSAKDWMVKTPSGYFNATQGARTAISFVKGTELYKLDQFFDKYYRPDLLEKILNNKVKLGSINEDLEKTYKEEIKLAVSPDPDGKTALLFVKIPQKNIHLLDELKVSHNGKKLPQALSHQSDSSRSLFKTVKVKVNLVAGVNVFEVHPVSKNRIESKPSQIKLFSDKAQHETNCHIVAIGINNYVSASMRLRYAKADAESFVQEFSQNAKSLFKNIYVHTLYDAAATRNNIIDSLEHLSRTVATHDVLVFYYAGHGSMFDDMFYLIPQDCQRLFATDKLESQGISAKELQEVFKKIKALKQLIILDACQSGGSISTLALRGAGEEKAMAQLSRSAGVHIFASAGTEQSAKEVEELKHGLFTYVLIKALSGDADGSPKDRKVTVYELKSYIDDQVPELNKQYNGSIQYPYTFSLGQDFPLIYRKE